MKCDELQERWFEAYPVEGYQIIPTKVYEKKDADDAIAELKTENENIKDAFEGTTIAYNQVCDEYEQCDKWLRATKRALWLARAERANEAHFMWCQLIYDKKYGIVKFNIKKKWFEEDVKQGQTLHTPQGWADVWDEVEYRCRAKAEVLK